MTRLGGHVLRGYRLPVLLAVVVCCLAGAAIFEGALSEQAIAANDVPTPLLSPGNPVDWWFVFKFNTKTFPGCGDNAERQCPFGGELQPYDFSQQFVYASSANKNLQKGEGCAGATNIDPLGATFGSVYNNDYYFVIWNDQFYGDPAIQGCGDSCSAPWGHSKGMLAWNEGGEGLVLQVTTPSWPASGTKHFPRNTDGNTLGCVKDNDVKVSQHFFALKLSKDGVVLVLRALKNASVVTNPHDHQIAHIGGPADIQLLVASLGAKSTSKSATKEELSPDVFLLSKPSRLNVPPWQMVSSLLGGVSLRAATWWMNPAIPSTTAQTDVACWDESLKKRPGAVEIATTGKWEGTVIGLKGGPSPDSNHAKIGVSTSGGKHYAIFGDMNQQGALREDTAQKRKCSSSQNGRGGLFYVVNDTTLSAGVTSLIKGGKALLDDE
jgi:hypothetical protein